MSEEGSNTLNYLEEEVIEISDENEKPPIIEGVCGKCLGSTFVHTVKNGILGVAMRMETDGETRVPKLIKCDHDFRQNY